MDKLGKMRRLHWKEGLKISIIAKFESDLLKSNEDTAPPPPQLQTFLGYTFAR